MYCQQKKIMYLRYYILDINRLSEISLKYVISVVTKPVTDICNLSISLNKFPRAFKLAKVKPISKNNQKTNVSNYQPIFLLPIFVRVIEKVIHKQTTINHKPQKYKPQNHAR